MNPRLKKLQDVRKMKRYAMRKKQKKGEWPTDATKRLRLNKLRKLQLGKLTEEENDYEQETT